MIFTFFEYLLNLIQEYRNSILENRYTKALYHNDNDIYSLYN